MNVCCMIIIHISNVKNYIVGMILEMRVKMRLNMRTTPITPDNTTKMDFETKYLFYFN